MPIVVHLPDPLTDDDVAAVLQMIHDHCSPSSWKALVASLNANDFPYPIQVV
jgi:hypothetical protein